MTRTRRDPDRRLAQALAGNARAFREMAKAGGSEINGSRSYFLAIAIELALKAYLLQRGITDDWNQLRLPALCSAPFGPDRYGARVWSSTR